MCSVHRSRFRQQFEFLRRQFLQDGDLPFRNVLSESVVTKSLTDNDVHWVDRIFPPLITLWVFLGQVLSQDHSCRAAVARLIAHRASRGQPSCSAETGAYCQARKRLPEKFFSDVARQTGRSLEKNVDPEWLWKGRRVFTFDGTVASMPDTPENQKAYPQPDTQHPSLGFPLARIAAVFSLSCGAVLDLGFARYAGKGQGELSLLRRMWDLFHHGDVVLTDRLMCSWTELAILQQRGIDSVTRLSKRTADFRRGTRLGCDDHIVNWPKPTKPRSMDLETYHTLPDLLTVREVRMRVQQPGFRTRMVIVVTTLLDVKQVTAIDLADLYRARWTAEIDLKSLKQTMQMDVLRCKTPELVRKEVWTHVLAYNLIRTLIAQAATKHGFAPRTISFQGAIQSLEAFQPVIAIQGERSAAARHYLYHQLLDAIATHRVADRPNRFEPRLRKRRPKHYGFLRKTRAETKREMAKRVR
ncbi:MAG: IS4 family transposase [Planctomycetaceae bacterium]|nr:IS4 family transposase [Planctomycetaceae bacterium]